MSFATSPIAREPRLLARKVLKRLGVLPRPGPRRPPGGLALHLPAAWRVSLGDWFHACAISGAAPAAEYVFGTRWPREQLLELVRRGPRTAQGLAGDIKLGWDFARSHHFPIRAYLEREACTPELAAEAAELMDAPLRSPFWSCAMDVSLRAVNWLAADALSWGTLGRAVGPERWAGWLWQHLDVTWRHLEAFRISSNHYLANLLGLTVLGRVFPEQALARRSLAFARRELPQAMLAQTYEDGGVYEASLRYHALVTEMILLARLLDPVPWPPHALARLEAMCTVVANHRGPGGDLRAVGDDDSGRVFALDHASPRGRIPILLALTRFVVGVEPESVPPALHPRSGWWTHADGPWRAHFEFGGVGLHGEGAHAHDDDLSVCLDYSDLGVLCDPGSYLYTPDRAARDEFRSAYRHSTVRLLARGEEPGPLQAEDCFIWRGRPDPLPVELTSEGVAVRVDGIRREVHLDRSGLWVQDDIAPAPGRIAWWFFHLHPDVQYTRHPEGADLETGGERLALRLDPPMPLTAQPARFSPAYGTSVPSLVLRGQREADAGLQLRWRIVCS